MNIDPKKAIFLIDGSSFLYRAYYGLRPLHTLDGRSVQAVYSFCRMIKKLIDTFDPHHIAIIWDTKGKTFRHEQFPAYKATRQAAPSDLFEQKKYIQEFIDLIGMRQLSREGYEADDLMYSVAQERVKEHENVVLVTSDKDMGQVISEHVVLYDSFKDVFTDPAAFQEKMGFPVDRLPLYFALLGDTSDNIPGVKGIGKQGATEIAQQFSSLEDLYARIDQLSKKRTQQLLLEQKESAFLSKDLFLLRYVPTGLTKTDLIFDKNRWIEARPLFVDLQFSSLLKELNGGVQPVSTVSLDHKMSYWKSTYTFKTVVTREQLDSLCDLLRTHAAFALDTETDGLNSLEAQLIGLSFCVEEGVAYYVPCGHKTQEPHLDRATVINALKPILENPAYKKYFHNAKFDLRVLWMHGIYVRGLTEDTIIAAALVTKDWQRLGLKYLSQFYFNEEMLTFDDVVKSFKLEDFSYVPFDRATLYAAADAHQTLKLVNVMHKALHEQAMFALYRDIEMPLVEILFGMECFGINFDPTVVAALDQTIIQRLAEIEREVQGIALSTIPLNLNSPKVVADLLFNRLGLPPQKKSAKGTGYSTDSSVLSELGTMHVVPRLILEYRELAKLKNTYIDALPNYINSHTKRIHTSYSQITTATGRLSSTEPNLQNIPAEGSSRYGAAIRAAFIADEGQIFIAADYSQIELRVMAYLSQDPALIDAFNHNRDIHIETAARIFDIAPHSVTHEQRQVGKRINFSLLYGMTPYGLSKDLHIPYKDAKLYIERYYAQYPRVALWMEDIVAFAKEHGYVQTHWGRRRYIPTIYEKNKSLYEEACRIAINTVGQGTAAEIMKIGMLNLSKLLHTNDLHAHLVLQIHDELLLSVVREQESPVKNLVQKTLESVVDWNVPLQVTIKSGKTWNETSK